MDSCCETAGIVADGGDAEDVDACRSEFPGKIRGVRVDDVAEQEFSADRDEFGMHERIIAGSMDGVKRAAGGVRFFIFCIVIVFAGHPQNMIWCQKNKKYDCLLTFQLTLNKSSRRRYGQP